MSNIINTQNLNSDNPVYAKKLSDGGFSRYSEAPVSLPKFSIHQSLQDRDTFRKIASADFKQAQKEKEKTSTLTKILAVVAAVSTFFILEAKKII